MDELKPLGLGELIDRAVTLFRTHWRATFRIFLPLHLIQFVAYTAYEIAGRLAFPAVRNPQKMLALSRDDPGAAALQAALGYSSLTLLVLLTFGLAAVAAVWQAHYLAPHVLGGEPVTIGSAWQAAQRQAWRAIGAVLLSLLWFVGLGALLSVPSVGLVAGAAVVAADSRALAAILGIVAVAALTISWIGVFLWFVLRFFTSTAIVALEGLSAWQSLKRTRDFARGRVEPGVIGFIPVRVTVLLTIGWAAVSVVTMTGGAPSLLLKIIYGNLFNPLETNLDAVPLWAQVPADLLQYVVTAAVTPLLGVIQLMHYVDVRVRREGLDLVRRLERPAS